MTVQCTNCGADMRSQTEGWYACTSCNARRQPGPSEIDAHTKHEAAIERLVQNFTPRELAELFLKACEYDERSVIADWIRRSGVFIYANRYRLAKDIEEGLHFL